MNQRHTPFQQATQEEIRDREQERLSRESRCPMCGRSATGADWDLLKFAQAMNAALRQVRHLAEAAGDDGAVAAESILQALDVPYRFPLPDTPEEACDCGDVQAHIQHI